MYLEYAYRYGRQLNPVSGILIYPDLPGIPQDIILIPYEVKVGQDLSVAIIAGLNSGKGIFTYFQGMRWTTRRLSDMMSALKFEKGNFLGQHYFAEPLVRLSYGIITFDQTFAGEEPDEPDMHRTLLIEFSKTRFELDIVEFPRQTGAPKLFESVNLPIIEHQH